MGHDHPRPERSFTRDEIRGIATGFQQSRIVLTAFELGVFTEMGSGKRTSAEIAAALRTDPRATDRLMNALCAIGLLRKEGSTFANTPSSSRFLTKGSSDYMAGLQHTSHLWERWGLLTSAVRAGKSVRQRVDDGDDWLDAFIASMNERATLHAPGSVRLIGLEGVERVLDVGGGSGAYAMEFVRAGKGITAAVFDLPEVVPLTKTYIARAGLGDRVSLVAGDYLKDDLGSGFDIAFLSAIIHSNTVEENRTLLAKCVRAIRPGGRVVVQDFIMNEDRTSPPHGAFFALNMLLGTRGGDTYTEAEVRSWMSAVGLSEIRRQDTPFGTTQMIGRLTK